MLTLRELLMELANDNSQFRVYMPNRDCLGYESYFEYPAAPGVLGDFFEDMHAVAVRTANRYKPMVYRALGWDKLDNNLQAFLEKYGESEVFRLEVGTCGCNDYFYDYDEDGNIASVRREHSPLSHFDYEPCLEIYIIPIC